MTLATTTPNQLAMAQDSIWAIPEDMRDDFRFVRDNLPFISFNGKDGVYEDKASQDKNPENHPKLLEGIILGATYGQAWLPKESDGWSQKWLCRCPNKATSAPFLHPELKPKEVSDVLAKGAGKSCDICPCGKFQGKDKPLCGASTSILLLRDNNEVCLVQFGGTSHLALEKFIGATFKRKNVMWFRYHITFGREHQSSDSNTWWRAIASIKSEVDPSMIPVLSDLRRQNLAQADHTVNAHEPEAKETPSQEAAPATTAQTAPANSTPVASTPPVAQGSFDLTDDGEPIWGNATESSSSGIPF